MAGLSLARGHRGVVAVDAAGTPHSLARRLGLRAADVRRKLADLDITRLPSVEDVKAAPRRPPSPPGRTIIMPKPTRQFAAAAQVRRRKRGVPEPATPADPAYWTGLGHQVEAVAGILLVTLPGGLTLEDRGDEMIVRGTPTPEATAAMVTAAHARGWQGIHFSGGDEAWQRAARLEAIRQGFPADAIILECEANKPPVIAAMPDHIRRRLGQDTPPKEEPAPDAPIPAPSEPVPAPGYRP